MAEGPLSFLFVANTPRDPLAGASGADISLIEALRNQGHLVDEIWADHMPRRIAHPNLHQLLELPRNFARAVASKCESKNYDVIQVNQPHAWLAAKQHRLSGRPGIFINRSHGWEPAVRKAMAKYGAFSTDTRARYRKLLSRLLSVPLERHNKKVVRWSDGVVLCSTDDYEYIQAEYATPAEKLLSMAPGIDPFYFGDTQLRPDSGRWKNVLYIGNFCPQKAPEVVAEVFKKIIEEVPAASGTWICPSKFHDSVRGLLGEQSSRQVHCLDWMSKSELRDVMDRHGIFIFPSYFEGFSLTFLQAMARGMCVLGTNIDGMRQAIIDGENGFLFERGAVEDMSARCTALLNDRVSLGQISAKAIETARQYTWERAALAYIEFCRTTIARAKRRTSG